jgi:hypothetical protein
LAQYKKEKEELLRKLAQQNQSSGLEMAEELRVCIVYKKESLAVLG